MRQEEEELLGVEVEAGFNFSNITKIRTSEHRPRTKLVSRQDPDMLVAEYYDDVDLVMRSVDRISFPQYSSKMAGII